MKFRFITAKSKMRPKLPAAFVKALPDRLALFVTVQFKPYYDELRKQLEDAGKKVFKLRPPHSMSEGQLLGCGIKRFNEDFDAFLYVGDGQFHPLTLLVRNEQPVICYDPFTRKKTELTKKDVEYALKRENAGYVKFIASSKIGVLISLKPGQNRKRLAESLKKHFPEKDFYYFIFDQLDFSQLENFPFIESWVNTACPRIMIDDIRKFGKPVINIEALLENYLPEGTKIPPR
jgi:2-(3-amino-3-carboxypropyl)histidine synthase